MYQKRRSNPSPSPSPSPYQGRERGSGKPYQKPTRPITLTVSPGQVAFRLLCSIHAGSGVIGHSGSVVKRLYKETSARIHVDDAVSAACTERIVHVIGSETLDRWLRFDEESCFHVSAAQEGLIRVFERVLELETREKAGVGGGAGGEVVRCRLLVGGGLFGAVIGEGGRRIKKLVEESGAYIKIFSAELLPPCAASSDELVQITGGSLAVKKALVVVSQYIQQKALQIGKENEVTSAEILRMETNNVGVSGTVNEGVATKVVFRLLCPIDAASAVIGHKGRKIMALQDETGASITFSSREGDCNERVVTVSAIENRKSNHSSAQNAVVRVFNESTSSGGRTARLLIQPNQVSLFKNGRPSNMSEIQKATGAELQILEHNGPFGASTNERIIQIEGEYSSVLTALFRVSWRLREHAFDSMVARDSGALLPHELFSLHPVVQETATLTDRMNKCRISEEVNGSLPHKLPALQLPNGHGLPTRMDGPRDLTTPNNSFELGSGITSVVVANTTVEIVVSEDMFGSVYGDDGSNLARLRLISGATVEVQDPCSGSEGKVIISGTPDQTLAAQSLLQAFIMAAK